MDGIVAASASVEEGARIGAGSRVWDLTQIRSGATIGRECVVGRNVFIDAGVVVGDRCKVQNNALLYAPARLESGVFVGPAVVLTNDRYPRAINSDGTRKDADDWHVEGVLVGQGSSLGAGTVVLAGVTIGRWALIAAGSVIIRDVPDHALVVGHPGRRIGWVGQAGRALEDVGDGAWRCPETGNMFVEESPERLREL